jgi:hypothetical protein
VRPNNHWLAPASRRARDFNAYVGEEANRVEEVERGVVQHWDDVRQVYRAPEPSESMQLLSLLKHAKAGEIARAVGVSIRTIKAVRNGHAKPSPRLRAALLGYISTKPEI